MADALTIDEMEKLYTETQMRIRQALGFKEAENVLALMRNGLRMRRMEGWQPIESAPKDGTRITALLESDLSWDEHDPAALMGGWKRVGARDKVVGWRHK